MIDSAVFGQRAAAFLDERVWCAVPMTRGPHPKLLMFGVIVVPMSVRAFVPLWWDLAVIAATVGAALLYLRTHPSVIVARTDTELVVLRTASMSPSRPVGVNERLPLTTPRSIGPSRWMERPVTLDGQRYWVPDLYGYLVEWMVEMSAPVPPPFRGDGTAQGPRPSIS